MITSVFLRVVSGRVWLALVVLLLPYISELKFQPKTDTSLSGWSAPTPLTFETAKPRNTAQTSGTFFSIDVINVYAAYVLDIFALGFVYFVKENVKSFSLSQLQRWRL